MYNYKVLNNLSESIYAGNSTAVDNLPSWLIKSNFSRNNTDLIATSPDGEKLILVDYFTNFELPNLYTDHGLLLKGSVVNYLAGPLSNKMKGFALDKSLFSLRGNTVPSICADYHQLPIKGQFGSILLGYGQICFCEK